MAVGPTSVDLCKRRPSELLTSLSSSNNPLPHITLFLTPSSTSNLLQHWSTSKCHPAAMAPSRRKFVNTGKINKETKQM